MKRFIVIIAAGISALFSLAYGQFLETVVDQADSLCVCNEVWSVNYVPDFNKVYVSGSGSVVIDAASEKRVAVLPVKAWASFYNPKNQLLYLGGDSIWVVEPGQDVVVAVVAVRLSDGDLQQTFAFDSLRNRLYCLGDGNSVSVIDCAENRLVARIDVGAFPFALDYAGVADKVYCLTLGFRLQVIDPANLIILKTISVGWPSFHPLYYSPVNNRLYITDDLPRIMVIDCASDSVIGAITPPGILCGGQYNPQRNTVHLLVDDGSSVAVFDCATNSFVSRFRVPAEVFVGASFDPVNQRFYYIETDWRIGTVDGCGDSLINCQVVGPIDWIAPLTVNPLANQAYCGNVIGGSISVIDGSTGAVKSVIPVGRNFGPVSMCYIPGRDVVYCANGNGVLSVIDCRTNQIINKIPAGTGFAQMIYLPENHKVYAVANTEYDLDIINARNDSLLAEIHYEFMLKPPLLDLPNGRVYCLDGLGNIVVFDKEQDKILGTIELNAEMLEHNPISNEVYAAGQSQKRVVVIDAGQDSISGRIEVNNDITLLKFSPKQNRLYCFHPNGLVSLIDPQARRVIRQVFAPAPAPSVQSIWNPVADKFYYSTGEKLVVFSCRSDSVAAIIDLCYSTPLLTDTIANKVYAGTENEVAVIDGNTNRLLKTIATAPAGATIAGWSPWNQRAYFAGGDSSSQISVIRDFNLTGKSTSLPVLPAVVRGSIFWHRDETGYLYDATGKRIRKLLPGKNSLEQIAPGVYFVRQRSAGEPRAKVIVIK